MANSYIAIDEPSTVDKKLDTEQLTVGANTVERERVRIAGAAAGDLAPVDSTNGLAVDPKTLPPGAATAARQDTGNTSLSSIDGKLPALASGRVPVDGSGVTQPVSAASLPLPTGAATAAKQPALGTAGTPSADVLTVQGVASMTAFKVDGSAVTQPVSAASLPLPSGAAQEHTTAASPHSVRLSDGSAFYKATTPSDTQPVSAASLPLPTGAATETTLGTRLSESDFDSKIGSLTEAAPASDTASSGLNGRLQRIAQRLTSLITALGSPFQAGGSIGNTGFQAYGEVAHDAVDSGNPQKIGAQARSTDPAAVASADRVNLIADLLGKLITLPYAIPENSLDGTATSTGTDDTAVIAAQGAGTRIYVTTLIISNTSATDTEVVIKSGTTARLRIPAPQKSGAVITLPEPLRLATNEALNFASASGVTTMGVSAVGYKGV